MRACVRAHDAGRLRLPSSPGLRAYGALRSRTPLSMNDRLPSASPENEQLPENSSRQLVPSINMNSRERGREEVTNAKNTHTSFRIT